ncbi:hypothetical protein FOS14_05015 [Skermania sp. ID1734]|uniref:hypothetical protein n=1 Tax=Skermania sp. ID1734 TaxID=2597516 RepID=UPI00118142E1|nr:hypothetical protein [Skermania sp. ID1734]TSE01110.1 hypothetical protein FOS14_05015 [Skermania sp. ID1734]
MDDHHLVQGLLDSVHAGVYGGAAAESWNAPGAVPLLADDSFELCFPVQFGATVAIDPRADDQVAVRWANKLAEFQQVSLDELTVGAAPTAPHAVVAALRERGCGLGGVAITVHTDVPHDVGAAAAVAIGSATALAVRSVYALEVADDDLVELVAGALQVFGVAEATLGMVGASMLGSSDRAVVHDRRCGSLTFAPFDPDSARQRILVVDTEIRGSRTGPGVEQDVAVAAAIGAGALGARAISDGLGAPVVALVPIERVRPVRAAVNREFLARNWRQPRFLTTAQVRTAQRTSHERGSSAAVAR